jgi:hypothetical protein
MKKTTLALCIGSLLSTQVFAMQDTWSSSSSSDGEEAFTSTTVFNFNKPQQITDIWQSDATPAWKVVTMKGRSNRMLATPLLEEGQSSILSTEFISEGGYVSFDIFVRGQVGNLFAFYINDQSMIEYDETTRQYQLRFPLPAAGEPVKLKWVYEKKLDTGSIKDRVRLDNLKISGQMDSDLDGFNDAWEFKYFKGLESVNAGNAGRDFDDDGFSNQQEYDHHTDPNQADTDGDGWQDSKEISMGMPPLISNQTAIAAYQVKEAPLSFELAESLLEQGAVEPASAMLEGLANDRSFAPAMRKLGLMYLYGLQVSIDVATGIDWLQQAAEQNHLVAQVELYHALLKAQLTETAAADAFTWLEKAAAAKHIDAYYWIAEAYHLGQGVAQDDAVAHTWYQKVVAADFNLYQPQALQRLGELYQNGQGVDTNLEKANAYFIAAFQAGYRTSLAKPAAPAAPSVPEAPTAKE